jgi:serine/threonine-protein kinase
LTVEAATRAVTDLKAAIGATDSVFDGSIPAGSVISATRESDGGDVSQGGDYFQGMNVNLVVSLGPVPDVAGKPVDEASAALTAVGLVPEPGEQTYSDDVPEGAVISASPVKEGPVRAGDTISLTVSRGPEPVEVPNVVGQTWASAKKALQDAGFSLDYNLAADLAPGLVRVSETDPAAGELVPKGTTIKVSF